MKPRGVWSARSGLAAGMVVSGIGWMAYHLALSTMTAPRLMLLAVCAVVGILVYPEKNVEG